MRSCHNFTHQNCVAIYCAGFPNWLVSGSVIVVSLNLSVILSLLKVAIKQNKYTKYIQAIDHLCFYHVVVALQFL